MMLWTLDDLKLCHPRCVRPITQSCSVCIYLYITIVMNTIILQLVAIYNIQHSHDEVRININVGKFY